MQCCAPFPAPAPAPAPKSWFLTRFQCSKRNDTSRCMHGSPDAAPKFLGENYVCGIRRGTDGKGTVGRVLEAVESHRSKMCTLYFQLCESNSCHSIRMFD